MKVIDHKRDDYMFNLRCTLTATLILKYKSYSQYDVLLTLIKSNIDEDLILAKEIMLQLAI